MSARKQENFYRRDPRDFLESTIGFSLAEKAAYSTVLDLCALHGRQLPDTPAYIAAHMTISVRSWLALRSSLLGRGVIVCADGILSAPALDRWDRLAGRTSLAAAIRLAVFERDGYQCQYCFTGEGPFEVDHVHPVSRGGLDDFDNLVCACVPCNRSKGAKLLSEWRCEA